jgi:hypothetical protein
MSPEKAERPQVAEGITFKLEACYDIFVILNGWNNESHREMFLKSGPQGSCSAAMMNALSILFSIARRCGIPLIVLANLFSRHGGSCSKAMKHGKKTCISAIGELLSGLVTEDAEDDVGIPMAMGGNFRIRFTGCGPMMVACGNNSDGLRYVDAKLAKSNTCAHTMTSIVADLITLMLGYGIEPDKIIHGLRGISCPAARDDNSSCLDGIARAIADHVHPPQLEDVIPDFDGDPP